MPHFKDDWSLLKKGKRTDFLTIAAITATLLVIVALNIYFIFRITAKQTDDLGRMELDRLRGELQDTLADAERTTLRVAVSAEQMLAAGASQEDIRNFFEHEQREHFALSKGECFNVYIACREWAIIPNFNMPAEYHAPERLWYKGAAENPGKVYITEPYVDAAGNGMCFTVSLMLSDKNTVVALDYNFTAAQATISKMDAGNDRTALIVTKSGLIVGYSDTELVGLKLPKVLPEYKEIFAAVTNSAAHESFEAQLNGRTHTIFSSETDNGWYMILSVDTSELYRDDYRRILLNSALNLWMVLVIVFYYLNSMKNRLQAERALRAKEEFLSSLSTELRAPLQRILKLSNVGALGEDNPSENAARVRESAMQLSEMLDNLFSFSTIVNADDREKNLEQRAEENLHMSKVSRTARIRIIAVLTVALILRIGISIDTNLGWGDTKMAREVETYDNRLNTWLAEQRSILSVFVNLISEHPELMNDYPAAVKFLDDIAKHYPEISVCYLANPYKAHQVIMNTGWESDDPNWRVDKRPWYIETELADNNDPDAFTVSSPYIDDRTGNYCVTVAKVVYGKNGEFLGIFAIDFYIDRLIQILAASYSAEGYAFLVDKNGIIINHPHFSYQMANDKMTDILGTEYRNVYTAGKDFFMADFHGRYMTCVAKSNELSKFTVVVVNNWFRIYGQILIHAVLFVVIYGVCVGLVVALVNNLLKWQTEVQRKLKDAATAALNAGQAKSQFLAQMSHEIRTPINAVLGMNEMILREATDKDIRDYAANIESASRTLLNLINSILDFSKIEEGKMEIIPVRYETLNMIDDLVNMIYDRAHKKNLSLVTKIDPQLPKVLFGDDMRVKQVITNLLTNAVKYTKSGTITLTMRGEISDDTLNLFVSVEDTGIGIRAEDIDKLFQSFRRLDEERNRNIEGTGLGISIVKELLRMMNSRLEVASVYGEGSTFSFTVRQKILDATPIGTYGEHHAERQLQRATTTFIHAPAAKILAVDDTAMNLKVINGLLKRNEIVPDLADSGAKCLELAAKNFYHIIFLDHMMPEMDGIETLQRLKKMNLPAETKIIVLTANAISGARESYLAKGFDDYLSKPIDVAALENILATYLPQEIIAAEKIVAPEKISAPAQESASSLIDMTVAMTNCMDTEEFFAEMAREFINGDKTAKLDAALAAGDMKAYRISVHALKSTSLIVGAVSLSESAKISEAAAKSEDLAEVSARHGALMELYKSVRTELAAWLEKNS